MSRCIYLFLSVGVLLLVTACGGGGGGSSGGGNQAPSPSGNLVNSGSVTGTNGVSVRALSNTLSTPINVSISVAAAPVEPMWNTANLIGDFFELRSDQDIRLTNSASPFVVAVPVPLGVDTAHLALAMRVPSEELLDSGRTGWEWMLLPGQYDAVNNLFLTSSSALRSDGRIFVLVEHPDYSSPTLPTLQPVPVSVVAGAQVIPLAAPVIPFNFFIQCVDLSPTQCPTSLKIGLANYLAEVANQLTSMGFMLGPALEIAYDDLSVVQGNPEPVGYNFYIAMPGNANCTTKDGPVLGVYDPDSKQAFICTSGADVAGGLPIEMRRVVVHELFHSFQFAYWTADDKPETFLIEGTATAAEFSYYNDGALYRSDEFPLRRVDVPLTFSNHVYEYQIQDFWIYAGTVLQNDMNYLILIFELGGTIDAIDFGLRAQGDKDLPKMYWAWVKNQVFEKDIDLGGILQEKCHFQVNAADSTPNAPSTPDLTDYGLYWLWKPLDTPVPYIANNFLLSLDARTVRVEMADGFPLQILIKESSNDPDIAYKVYSEFDTACAGEVHDGSRILDTNYGTQYGQPNHYYVLLANLNKEIQNVKNINLTGNGL